MKRATSLLGVVLTCVAALVAAPAARAALRFFRSPSGNIGCLIDARAVRCDVLEKTWRPPPKPPSCRVDWGGGVEVGRRGSASYVCAGDTVVDPGSRRLAYGRSIRAGRFTCTSRVTGMRCVNRRNGHGFLVSRERVVLR